MSSDALVARMEADAQSRIVALRAEADAGIAALEGARAAAAALDQTSVLAARRAERERTFAVERAQVRRAAARRILDAQHALVERVFTRALVLASGAQDRLIESLPALVEALAGHLHHEAVTLRCRPALADALRRCASVLGEVDVVTDEAMPPGFVAATRDGRCTVDCTLAARLAALRPALQPIVLERALR